MNALSIVLLIILILVAIIIFLLVKTINVSVQLDTDKLKVHLFNIKVYSADYEDLIVNILQGKKMKIKIKIMPLIRSISFVGIKVKYQKEYIDQIDAYIYGLLNIFSMFDIKRIDSFKYQRAVGENKIEIIANIKVRLLKLLLSQWSN